jgi:ATP-dependent Clp protease adaptor protein ClpS
MEIRVVAIARAGQRWGEDGMASIFRWGSWRATHSAQPALPRTDEDVRRALRQLPHYRVMLHNDDHNAMDHVVVALVRTVPLLSIQEAMRIMLEAHTSGLAQVIVCPKETAEFYREGLEHYGLTSTIEPA